MSIESWVHDHAPNNERRSSPACPFNPNTTVPSELAIPITVDSTVGVTPALKFYNVRLVGSMRYARCDFVQPWRPTYHLIEIVLPLLLDFSHFTAPSIAFTSVFRSPVVEVAHILCKRVGIWAVRSINGFELRTVEGDSNAGREEEGGKERSSELHYRSSFGWYRVEYVTTWLAAKICSEIIGAKSRGIQAF